MKQTALHTPFLQRASAVILFAAVSLFCMAAGATPLYADSMSVSITPPLLQLSIGPGESWASSIKIVNNNASDETYYAQLVDMEPSGENGNSKFIPVLHQPEDPAHALTLAQWMQIPPDPITIKAGTSANLPFTVSVPEGAEPGGHYAAILIGTEPNALHATGTVLKVSSYVSSLIFVTIKGDVIESGRIREFTSSQNLYQSQNADFSLRFENTGNTHVRPQGDITIYNMWGKQRGQVLINQDSDSNFGNVLPNSIRKFEFSWAGEGNPFDIGLYSAVVTLSYGHDGKKNTSATVYFWVVPVLPMAVGTVTVLLFVLLFIWLLRRYIRRALLLEQKRYGVPSAAPITPPSIIETLIEPVREGVIDLRQAAKTKNTPKASPMNAPAIATGARGTGATPMTWGEFIQEYKLFLVFIALVVVAAASLWFYFDKVLLSKRGFQITDVHIQAEDAPVPAKSTQK